MPLIDTDTTDRTSAGVGGQNNEFSGPVVSRADRTPSFDATHFSVPRGREEDWRFTPVDRLGELFAEGEPSATPELPEGLPAGVTASVISLDEAVALGAQPAGDRAAAVAATRAGGVLRLDIANDAVLDEPVRLSTVGKGQTTFAHVIITAGRHSRGTVVLLHNGSATLDGLVSLVTGDGADVTLVSLQEWEGDAVHLAQHDIVVGRDATVRHIAVTLGGKIVRLSTNTTYAGPGGSFEGLGVYFADAGQHLEHRLFVDHSVPNCSSNVEYKGALQGESARTVWVGDVLIRAEAVGTDTYELNRNLVLTDGAQADSVPNLEIETGEIAGAGHASTTGRLDDEQLFYLMSRGIDESEAHRIIVNAFFAELIRKIGIDEVVDRLVSAIEAELELTSQIKGEQTNAGQVGEGK